MAKTRRQHHGFYSVDRYGEHPEQVNGTVKRFRRWRRDQMRQARRSRRINRR